MAPTGPNHLTLTHLPQLAVSQPRSGSSTANNSPIESNPNNPKPAFAPTNGLGSASLAAGSARLGSASPSLELGGRLYSKRARDIQAQERIANPWGPPTSGNSTPLRENIPESPTDGFPDFKPQTLEPPASASIPRRVRAGTLPSRFSSAPPSGSIGAPPGLSKSSRATPTGTPFPQEIQSEDRLAPPAVTAALLSRLRSGSMPQRASIIGPSGPFGPTVFSTNWSANRERGATLTSLGSANGPSSPAQSSFSKDGIGDNEMRTLDYLGLADTPQPALATLAKPGISSVMEGQMAAAMPPFLADLVGLNRNLNRFRSYSVNAKEKYAEEEDEELGYGIPHSGHHSGTLTPSAASAALAITQTQIHAHNLAVQAYANQASASRPRARTAGVLDSPPQRSLRNYLATPSRLDNSITAADLGLAEGIESLPEAVEALQLSVMGVSSLEQESPTRALWLGNIPASSTATSLSAIFGAYGKIESARVLTHKNCGFVNFEALESAIQAKTLLNGKEIFPGAGPLRIGYAKVPEGSAAGTPGANGMMPSPSPEPFSKGQGDRGASINRSRMNGSPQVGGTESEASVPSMPPLPEVHADILNVVRAMGTSEDDVIRISASLDQALQYDAYEAEIPPVPEPTHRRMHDAPKLREIRKRIDNGSCTPEEIEDIALGMLPEIAELSSDYLGNTVVQKLFEFCSEPVKHSMLAEIAPHMAEIGVHKNGTWAAQKIIDLAKDPAQMSMIVESLRPYTVPLFLDQYGNYVLQCVLRFGSPWNNFIFESMLSRLSDVSRGRFGARAMRACLESHHASKAQQRMLAAAIAVYGVQLSTDTNGALLLTWLLDTCTFPRRRTVLAPRLVPHLVQLCTHKVAYLTVLKAINQRNEPEAREMVLQALFFSENDQILEEILRDSGCGATLIFKVLTTPFFEERMRSEVVQNVRNVLVRLKAQPAQGYKRLMDEVGLSTRSGGGASGRDNHPRDRSAGRQPSQERGRPGSRHRTPNNRTPQQGMESPYKAPYHPSPHGTRLDPAGVARASSADPHHLTGFEQFGLAGMHSPMFTPQGGLPMSPLSPQQLQYQQALMASGRPPGSTGLLPGMANMGGFPTPSPSFRSDQGQPSPMPPFQTAPPMFQPGGFPPGFNPLVGQVVGGMPMPPMNGMQFVPQQQPSPQQQQQQQQQLAQGGNRRGRVS
ncbi:MAG: Mitochondrial beta-keto-acyl synthase [Watsoniomyces obsoletus]|nr:MAG: Mitochondrial beta-keto-acyl synthase [Watsoniomyces obsoletus]